MSSSRVVVAPSQSTQGNQHVAKGSTPYMNPTYVKVAICALGVILGATVIALTLAGILPNVGSVHAIKNIPAFISANIGGAFIAGLCLATLYKFCTDQKKEKETKKLVASLQQEKTTLQGSLATAQGASAGLEQHAAVLKGGITAAQEAKAAFEKNNLALQSALTAAQGASAGSEQRNASLQKDLTATQEALKASQAEIEKLTATQEALKASQAEIEKLSECVKNCVFFDNDNIEKPLSRSVVSQYIVTNPEGGHVKGAQKYILANIQTGQLMTATELLALPGISAIARPLLSRAEMKRAAAAAAAAPAAKPPAAAAPDVKPPAVAAAAVPK